MAKRAEVQNSTAVFQLNFIYKTSFCDSIFRPNAKAQNVGDNFTEPWKKIAMKKYLILIILTLTVLTIFICQIERKEVKNSKQLKEEIIKEVVNKLNPKDSLFIVTARTLGVCGNDERYDGFTTPIEKFSEIKFILENPYFVDGSIG